jgi:hypothetical protein
LFTENTNILVTEDEPSGLKHAEDIVKLKQSFNKHAFLLVYFILLFYNVWYKKHLKTLATALRVFYLPTREWL